MEFLYELPTLIGILKKHYSDFQVFEIDTDGKYVSQILDTTVPIVKQDNENDKFLYEKECDFINQNITEIFKIKVNGMSKSSRKSVHQCVRKLYLNLRSATMDIDDEKYIMIYHKDNVNIVSNDPKDNRSVPKYLRFILYKEGIDTHMAIMKMARILGIKQSRFSFAGTKDKRAISTQNVCVFKIAAEQLNSLINNNKNNYNIHKNSSESEPYINSSNHETDVLSNDNESNLCCDDEMLNRENTEIMTEESIEIENGDLSNSTILEEESFHGKGFFKVGHFKYDTKPLSLGELNGNHFRIIIRNIQFFDPQPQLHDCSHCNNTLNYDCIKKAVKATIENSVNVIKCLGFVNYFGTQRFGINNDTCITGKYLIKGDYGQALATILDPNKPKLIPELRHYLLQNVSWYNQLKAKQNTLILCGNDHTLPLYMDLPGDRFWSKLTWPSMSMISKSQFLTSLEKFYRLAYPKNYNDDNDQNFKTAMDSVYNSNESNNETCDLNNNSLPQPNFVNHSTNSVPHRKIRDSIEYRVIKALNTYGIKDVLKIFNTALHRNLRLLYVHAYQSYIWNRVASFIISTRRKSIGPNMQNCNVNSNKTNEENLNIDKLYELKVGDLVYDNDVCPQHCPDNEVEAHTNAPKAKKLKKDIKYDGFNRYKPSIVRVTGTNLSKYSFSDMVIPLPGFAIEYPSSPDILGAYKTYLAYDDLSINDFKHNVKTLSLPGDYRKLIERPNDMDASILSDCDYPDSFDVSLQFSLPPSSYATVCLRELMHQHETYLVHL